MKCLCVCNHFADAKNGEHIAVCDNCGRVWKWINGPHENDWTMIAGPRKKRKDASDGGKE